MRRCLSWSPFTSAFLFAFLLTAGGCGKPDTAEESPPQYDSHGVPVIPVYGEASFANQCPYGSSGTPAPVKLSMWGCPVKLKHMDLAESMKPLFFQADCTKKNLMIRSSDRPRDRIDTSWEAMPDGSFAVSIEKASFTLQSDGMGGTNCVVPVSIDLWGKIACRDQDHAKISVQANWTVKKPPPATAATSGVNYCSLPDTCYIYADSVIRQCD